MNPLTFTDSYKLSHKGFMNEGTEVIYSNMTPRSDKYFTAKPDNEQTCVVSFGLQAFIKEYLIDEWNREFFNKPKEEVIGSFKRLIDAYLGEGAVSMQHFEELHDLGYLPIEIKAIEEGNRVNIGVPVFSIVNTHLQFGWFTNYLETVMSCELWKPMTTATTMYYFRKLVNEFAMKTTGSLDGTQFQLHGFEFRGMSGRHDAMKNAAAMLLSTNGTDTVPALPFIEKYYGDDITQTFVATSVPASEHSVACLGTAVEGELNSYRKWITKDYPTGIVSLVSDTYDYWKVLTEYLPELKEDIMNRPVNALGLSKVVIRPDSGDPVRIICGYEDHEVEYTNNGYVCLVSGNRLTDEEVKGSIQILWEIFGGEVNELGYKVLDSHIGLIYGDSITYERAKDILSRLERKGFASTCVVLGIGSYSINYVSRDTLGFAVKATAATVNGVDIELFKDPKTDDGTKKSARGRLVVVGDSGNYSLIDQIQDSIYVGYIDRLKPLFKDGKLVRETSFDEIKTRLWSTTNS